MWMLSVTAQELIGVISWRKIKKNLFPIQRKQNEAFVLILYNFVLYYNIERKTNMLQTSGYLLRLYT